AGSCALNPTANQSEPSAEPATVRCVPRGRPQVRMGPGRTSVSSNNDVSPASEKFLADIRSDNADIPYAAWSRAGEIDPEVIPELGKLLAPPRSQACAMRRMKR